VQVCQEVSTLRGLTAYAVALPTAAAVGVGLYAALGRWRRGNPLLRFIARVWIIGGGYTAAAIVMRLIGGPCILAGPTRRGGYDSDPVTGQAILWMGLTLGVLGALLWPVVVKAKGHEDLEW